MRVELTTDGGFAALPGLARTVAVDAGLLASAAATELADRVAATIAASPPAEPVRHPDARRYRVVIDVDGTRHRFVAADPVTCDPLARLIAFVRAHGRAA
jgi:hypothetical protein